MKIVITLLLSALIFGGGIYYWQGKEINNLQDTVNSKEATLQDLNKKNNSLSNEVDSLNAAVSQLEDDNSELNAKISLEELRKTNTKTVFDMLKDTSFYPEPSNQTLLSVAILINDISVCDEMDGQDVDLCKAIFTGGCDSFEYPNFEMCKKFETMLNRGVEADDLIAHCNSKENVTNDMSQTHCFQNFARITNNLNLCYEICENPIDNTNCKASCRDDNDELVSCKEQYIEECKSYVSDNLE